MLRKFIRVAAILAASAIINGWPVLPAQAACSPPAGAGTPPAGTAVTCSGTTTAQNAPNGYGDGSQTGLIINVLSGASVAAGSGGHGLNLAGANNINNAGTLAGGDVPAGIGGNGINITGNNSIIVNSGSATGGNNAGSGIGGNAINITGNNSTITNSGSATGGNVAGSGVGGNAISIIGNNSTITNSGSLTGGNAGTGAVVGGSAIFIIGNNSTITNSGSATGGNAGDGGAVGGDGITVIGSNSTIRNAGTARGGNAGIVGGVAVFAGNGISVSNGNNLIINTGSALGGNGNGAGSHAGIGARLSGGNNTLVNFGLIATGTGNFPAGVVFSGNSNTLTNVVGSRIIGPIQFGGSTGNTVNFVGGNWAFTFDLLAGATINAGGAPFAIVGSTVIVVDPTPFAMTDRNLMDFTRSVSSILGDRFDDTGLGATGPALGFANESDANTRFADAFANIPGMSAYASSAAVFKNPTVQYSDGTTVWGRGFAGQRVQQADGILLRTLNQFYGGMVGGDWQAQANLRLGAFLGGGKTRSSEDFNIGSNDSDIFFGGLFGRYSWGASFLGMALQGGHTRTDTTRNISNNLVPGGLETAKASYDGWYINPEATYGLHYGLGSWLGASYTLTPSLNLRYLYASFGSYTESGTTAPLTINSQTVSDFEERGQLKLTRTQVFGPSETIMTHIYGGLLGVQRAGDTTVDATLLGQAIPFATPGKNDVWGGFGGAGLELRTGRVTLFASAEYLALSDLSSVVSGQGGIRIGF